MTRLVLSRKVEESIWIAPNIKVTIGAIDGARVKLLIEAPRGVVISREPPRL